MNTNAHLYIKFFAPVVGPTIAALMETLDDAVKKKVERITLLISTPGGNVFEGLSAYNYLKGLPIPVHTHNFGSVDSIGVVLFCAGENRLSVPHARVLLHGVSVNFQGNARLEEKQLEEHLKGLQIDQENIARVVADTTGKTKDEIINAMHDRTTLNPDEAKAWSLVTEIKSELFPSGARVIAIQVSSKQQQPPSSAAAGPPDSGRN